MTSVTGSDSKARNSGFTMIELLITISIIFLLFSMLAVAAGPMRTRAKTKNTEGMIERVSLGLQTYHSKLAGYPSDGFDGRVETDEGNRLESGAAMTFALTQEIPVNKKMPDGSYRFLGTEEPVSEFKESELTSPYDDDPQARELLDGFYEPFHYDRVGGSGEKYNRQDSGDVHLEWDDDEKIHHDDPREETGVAVSSPGAQNIGEFDVWSHGPNGHQDEEVPEEVIANWTIPASGS